MSIEHDSLSVDPRLETLLRGLLTANDLQPSQNARVRAQLGLAPSPSPTAPTLTLPAAQGQHRATEPQASPPIAPPRRLGHQWLQFALAAVAFVAVGVVLSLLFGSGSDEPELQPGAITEPAQAVRDALAPLPPDQERRTVLEVETHTTHDNAFDRWTIERWQRWSATGVLDEGLFASGPSGESVTHIILDGQASLMNWAPRDWALDVPLEYSLQRRVLAATLAAVDDPETHNLRSETRDGQVVLTFEWNDNQSEEFNYIHRGEAWIDPETGHLERIVHFVDRPEQDPYPTRTYTFLESEILPAGSSPDGTYTIEGSTRPLEAPATATAIATTPPALPTPDEMGMYQGITLEQAQQIVSFEIAAPERIPDGLEPPDITVVESQSRTGPTYRVEMFFELAGDESPGQSIQFIQISSPGSGEPNMPEAETTTTVINGVEVNRTTGRNIGGDPLLAYWWARGDVRYQILASLEGDLTPALVEQLMFSILVPPGPTAEEVTARLEQERAAMMPYPIPDSCAVSDWVGPDFRVGEQHATAYALFDNGLSLWTTHGLLFAGENTIVWLADAPLTTTEALSGPVTIRAVQSDGTVTEIPIDITEQLYNVRDTERAWLSTVSFPSEGCWEIQVELGVHSLEATVYVYER